MAKFIYEQTTPSVIWSITHNLGKKPVFDVLVYEGGELVKSFPQYVEYVSDNVITLTFSTVRTGKVILAA